MAAIVKINSGSPAAWMRPYEVDKARWTLLMGAKKSFLKTNIPYDCRCLLEFVQDAEEMYESLGFKTPSEMILNGYELDPEEVNLALSWLKIVSPEDVISYQDAVDMGRTLRDRPGAPEGSRNNPMGRAGKTNCVINTISKKGHGSTNTPYLTARLKRDNPEILEKYKQGEFPSVRQAAIAAGIVNVPTALERVFKLLPKLSKEEIKELQLKLLSKLSKEEIKELHSILSEMV